MSVQISAESWLHTAKNVRLIAGSILYASLRRKDQTWRDDASIDLNDYIGTADGKFLWGSSGFRDRTANATVTDRRPNAQEVWLLGNVLLDSGDWPVNANNNNAGLSLADAMKNIDGEFEWIG